MYLLDTNACIALLNDSSPRLVARVQAHVPAELRISAVTKAELLYGARRSRKMTENLRVLQKFFAVFVSLPFDDACAEQYGAIRAELESTGRPIGPNDLLIGAIARAHDMTLVTNNSREFSRIVGLKIEDWQ